MIFNSFESILSKLSDSYQACQTRVNVFKDLNYERKLDGFSLVPMEYNYSINISDDLIEIIKYKKNIKVVHQYDKEITEQVMYNDGLVDVPVYELNRDRLFKRDDVSGELYLNRSNMTLFEALERSKFNVNVSRKRTLDNLYSLSLSNKWRYFFTLTIDRSKYNSVDPEVINTYYKNFCKKCKTVDPDISMLFILEYHADKENIHLHGLVNGDLSDHLTRAINPNTNELIIDSFGNPIYNCDLWGYGFSTCAEFSGSCNKLRVANYISKYVSKEFVNDSLMPYGTKMLYHTRGLNRRVHINTNLSDRELISLLIEYYYDSSTRCRVDDFLIDDPTKLSICTKDNERFTVYHLSYSSA